MYIMKKNKKIATIALAGMLLAANLVGCSKTDDKELDNSTNNTEQTSPQKEALSVEEASSILYETIGQSDLWWDFNEEWEGYYTFLETSIGADYRFLMDKYTGEVFYQSIAGAEPGEVIPFANATEDMLATGPKSVGVVSDLKTQISKPDTLKQAKAKLSDDIQNMIKENEFEITDATETDDFVISNTTYNKYTEDYNQLMFYVVSEDYTDGLMDFNIHLSQEIHADYVINKDDNFIKLLYDMYIYITSSDISIDDFVSYLQNQHESSVSPTELTDDYLGLSINNNIVDGSRKKISMNLSTQLDTLIKSEYHEREYETVAEYKETYEKTNKELSAIGDKYSSTESAQYVEDGLDTSGMPIVMTNVYEYDSSEFKHSGLLRFAPEGESGLFSKEEIDTLNETLKVALGDSIYEKADKSLLTVEHLNYLFEAGNIRREHSEVVNNVLDDFGMNGMRGPAIDINNASMSNTYHGYSISFEIPVIAEGIRGL